MKRWMGAVAMAVGLCTQVAAQEAPALAEVGLQARIDALQGAEHGFERGMLMALRAVEKTVQLRYEYGLGDRLNGLPLLRLEVGQRNPFAKEAQADTLSTLMRDVLTDLEAARKALQQANATGIAPFEMDLQALWFDANSNGTRDPGEDVVAGLAPLLLGRQALRQMRDSDMLTAPIVVRFDEADHAWLTAYTHMLSGAGNLFLAFDPTPVLQDLAEKRAALAEAPEIPNTFDEAQLQTEIAALRLEQERIYALEEPLRAQERDLRDRLRALQGAEPRDSDAIDAVTAQLNKLRAEELRPLRDQARFVEAEISAAEAKLEGDDLNIALAFRDDVDALYVLLAALRQQPDAARVRAAHDHWMQMIAQNKVFWTAVAAETDNDREWIPNGVQTSALPVTVQPEIVQGWQNILQDAQALLEGRLLLPHPLMDPGVGISLKAYVDSPGPISLLDWIHGIGAYPYAARGPLITRQRWVAFQRLTGGNAGGFALFFN